MQRLRLVAVAVLALAVLVPGPAAQQPDRLALVVVVAVDQLRADYFEKFQHQWSHGLRRLIDRGAWYRRAAYPYFDTVTCAGHATISTGTFPATNGQLMNEWYDRALGRLVNCTEDQSAHTISYDGTPRRGHDGPGMLLVPTLADEMRVQLAQPPRIVSLSLKPRSAIMLAGHAADLVLWFEGRSFATSSVYGETLLPFVERFLAANPIEGDLGRVWDRVQPKDAYLYPETTPEFDSGVGWGDALPHTVGSAGSPDRRFYGAWSRSPFSDPYLTDLAIAAIDELALGQEARTDYLAISYSALDRVGHDYGPRSHEVQDTLMRLDESLGTLLEHLDETVGPDRYVLALTADHGAAPIPEQAAKMGFDAGRLDLEVVQGRTDAALAPFLGEGPHVARINYTELYFAPGVYDRLREQPAALDAAIAAIESVPGVGAVYQAEQVAGFDESSRAVERALALNYVPGRSGDLIIVPKVYWSTSQNATGHGTSFGYDTHVPIVLLGTSIQAGRYDDAATPADVAPTLAYLAGITLARPDGRVLSEAIRIPPILPSP
jgi:hypothetical protein